ncbi:MAG: O-antigen ligase family protein, partial [Colwellia sp.]
IPIKYIFMLMLALSVFTSARYIVPLGELSNEAYAIPFLIILAATMLKVPYRKYTGSFLVLSLLLLFWIILSGVSNYSAILGSNFKGKAGFSKYIFQLVMIACFFALSFCVASIYSNRKKGIRLDYSTGIRCAFLISSLYALIEIPRLFGVDMFSGVRGGIDFILRADGFQSYSTLRLRSLAYESPSYANFLLCVCALCLADLVGGYSPKKMFLFALVFMLLILSGSRGGAAGLILLMGMAVFTNFSKKHRNSKTTLKIFSFGYWAAFTAVVAFILFADLTQIVDGLFDDYRFVSNIGRLGAQYASGQIFFDNPIFGVGLGQQGFYMAEYYPSWALVSWEVEAWSNPYYGTWPPGFSLYMRLLSETGIVGLFLFFYLNYVVLKYLLIMYLSDGEGKETAILAFMTIFSSLIVFSFFDSFRYIPYWVGLSMYLILKNYEGEVLNES